MNKQKVIANFKQIRDTATTLLEVVEQEKHKLTRLKNEAESALVELGSETGRGRKAAFELSADAKLNLIGNLTTGGGSKKLRI